MKSKLIEIYHNKFRDSGDLIYEKITEKVWSDIQDKTFYDVDNAVFRQIYNALKGKVEP